MLMEPYDIRVAALVIIFLDFPSVYLYSTRVMGIDHADVLVPCAAQILMLLLLQFGGSVMRARAEAARQLELDSVRVGTQMLLNSHQAGIASTSMSNEESGKEDKKTK